MYAGSTQKVKVSAGKSATAAKNALKSGGKSLGDEDTSTTVGAFSMSRFGVLRSASLALVFQCGCKLDGFCSLLAALPVK